MKKLFFLLALYWGHLLAAAEDPVAFWRELVSDFHLQAEKQSFCFSDGQGPILGHHPQLPVNLASTSKILTSLWALEELGVDYRFKTNFHYGQGHMHISGDNDPLFGRRKLFYLVNQFQQKGIYHLDLLTFDRNTKVYSKAEDYLGEILPITPIRSAQNLYDFLNPTMWEKIRRLYFHFIDELPGDLRINLGVLELFKELDFKVETVKFSASPINPQYFSKNYTHLSSPLYQYLKSINVHSNNFASDSLFELLGGRQSFQNWMDEKIMQWNMDPSFQPAEIYTGSGLPILENQERKDNTASCALMLQALIDLDKLIEKNQMQLSSIMPVAGSDEGTIRGRLRSERVKNALLIKTGTLVHTSALLGKMMTKNGPLYFGMFNHTLAPKASARIVQNLMVSKLLEINNEAEKFDYQNAFFFPADGPLLLDR